MHEFNIFVKSLSDGKERPLSVRGTMKLSELKNMVIDRQKYVDCFFIFGKYQLEGDHKTLDEFKIVEKSNLRVVYRLPGGRLSIK